MNGRKWILILSLFVVLMMAFGSISAQDSSLPAFKVSNVIQDEKVVLTTKNFPANTDYVISMAIPDNPEVYTPVARFNSKSGGNLNVSVKIPEKFRGLNVIELMMKDADGKTILGNFVNIPVEEPIEEPVQEEPTEEPVEEPVKEEPAEAPAEEPVKEEPAEEPAEEPVQEEPAEEPAEEPVQEEPAEEPVEEPVQEEPAEAPAEEPVQEEPAEEPVEEPVQEEPTEAPAEEPVKEEPAEAPAEETVKEESAEAPAEEPVKEEPAEEQAEEPVEEEPVQMDVTICNYSILPYTVINDVLKDSYVTFTTGNFPADSTFKVYMGYYEASWVPEPMHPHMPDHGFGYPGSGRPDPGRPGSSFYHSYGWDPIPDFKPEQNFDWEFGHHGHGPDHRPMPRGTYASSFNGIEAGSFETGNGEPQTLTFDIPESLSGINPIALWIEDQGMCGFYSYNYFYNNSTVW